MSALQPVTDDDFEQAVLKAEGPVLVDFWAEWCGPCRLFKRIIEEIADEYQGRLTVFAMNIDESPKTPAAYHISGIPALAAFKDGQLVTTMSGAKPKAAVLAGLEGVLP